MPFLDQQSRPEESAQPATAPPGLTSRNTKAMASMITVHVPATDSPRGPLDDAIDRALEEFHLIERACTRFDPASPLMRANRHPGRWHRTPEALYSTLAQARQAYRRTAGLFDPRVHDRLVELGYDRSFHLVDQEADVSPATPSLPGRPLAQEWRPGLVPGARLVHFGGSRVDLGGVGKGVALSRAAGRMRRATRDFLIDAGGDIYASGRPCGTEGWRVAVETPSGASGPVAVLEVSGLAVATSSTRIRRWRAGGRTVHHLIDPRTGEPGGDGLGAVTVVHDDPVEAETWAKALFLVGARGIAERADAAGLAAMWVGTDDHVGTSPAMVPYVLWNRR